MDQISYDFCNEKQRQSLMDFAKNFFAVRDFSYTWTLWKNWEKHPPIVAVADGKIIGFHAATLLKSGYINSYYQAVDVYWRGKQIGGNLVDFYLKQWAGKYNRIKLKTPYRGDNAPAAAGYLFWLGFGLRPYAIDISNPKHQEHLWDESLGGVIDIATLIYKYKSFDRTPLPDKVIEKAKEKGYQLL